MATKGSFNFLGDGELGNYVTEEVFCLCEKLIPKWQFRKEEDDYVFGSECSCGKVFVIRVDNDYVASRDTNFYLNLGIRKTIPKKEKKHEHFKKIEYKGSKEKPKPDLMYLSDRIFK